MKILLAMAAFALISCQDGCDCSYPEPAAGTEFVIGGTVESTAVVDDGSHKITKLRFLHDNNVLQDLILCGEPGMVEDNHYGLKLRGNPGASECYMVVEQRYEPVAKSDNDQ